MKLRWTAAGPVFVAIYFLTLTGHAVYTYFTPDDFMNLYQAWTKPVGELVKANLLFFLPSEIPRPLGSAWYRIVYAIAGLHPAPYKIFNLAIVVANIFLTYAVARRLAKSRTAGTLAALMSCYHPQAINLYFDTGYIFDVLCYFFYFSAAIVYLRARGEDRLPSWRKLVAICVLYICALNSKELAVTFPVFILLYEVIYHGRKDSTAWRRGAGILATGLITLAALIGKMLATGSLMHSNHMYRPIFTWHQFMLTSGSFTRNLFLWRNPFTPTMLIALWSAMLVIAWLARSRALRFAWLFIMLSPLPVAFIPPRGVSQYYIPMFGWSLYAAVLLDLVLGLVFQFPRTNHHRSFRNRTLAGAALVVMLAAVAYRPWRYYQGWDPYAVLVEAEVNRSVVNQLHRLEPRLPHDARLMFLDDPIDADWWNMTFMVHLSYSDRSIVVDRVKRMELEASHGGPAVHMDLASYDHVFDCRGGHFIELARPWRRAAAPTVVIGDGRPHIFHSNWTPVTRDDPARPDEDVIVQAADLGATVPSIPAGEPFPNSPHEEVVARVEARVNGAPAAVRLNIGWPGTTFYRVDIHVPPATAKGLSWIEITADGVAGPATEFPVH